MAVGAKAPIFGKGVLFSLNFVSDRCIWCDFGDVGRGGLGTFCWHSSIKLGYLGLDWVRLEVLIWAGFGVLFPFRVGF